MSLSLILGNEADQLAAELSLNCFQTRAWVDAVSVAHGIPYQYAILRYDRVRSGEGTVFLPVALRYRYGFPIFEAMPMGGYGGWVSDNGFVSVELQKRFTKKAALSRPWLKIGLVEDPIWASVAITNSLLGAQGEVAETHILPLGSDEDVLFSGFKSNLKSDLRRSDKKGYSSHRFNRNEDAVRQFYKLYEVGAEGWKVGGVNLPYRFFSSLSQSGCADIWLVEYEGDWVAAAFFIKGRRDVFYYASGTMKDKNFSPSPMDYLMWAAIKYYVSNGFLQMNFGASVGLGGVRKFKEKFGAKPRTYHSWSLRLPWLFAAFES